MASENGFTHISVNSGDDDVVIHAGATAVSQPDIEATALEEEWDAGVSEDDAEAYADGAVSGTADETEGQSVCGEGQDSAARHDVHEDTADAQPGVAPGAVAKNGYHETTLDDIQGSRMGTTQKVVIGLAIVLIVVIVIWQVAFNG